MKQGNYAGFVALPFEDYAVVESQGAITDRSKEHLGDSDMAIIRVRRLLLDKAQAYRRVKSRLSLPTILIIRIYGRSMRFWTLTKTRSKSVFKLLNLFFRVPY